MAGCAHPSRDLRLGLHALESGAIEREPLMAAIKAWATAPDRPFADVLAERGDIDGATLASLQAQVAGELDALDARDPAATVAHVPRSDLDQAEPGRRESDRADSALAGGRFELIRRHARGGLGEVWVAFDRELKRPVALKQLAESLAHDVAAQTRFLREAEVTGSLEHPGVVAVYSLGRLADGRPYYAMHLVEGETLRAAIERFHAKDEPGDSAAGRGLAFRRLLRCVIDACNAVAFAHSRGVIHRDLKPDNIMLGPFGETLVVDWGLAKRLDDDPIDATSLPRIPDSDLSLTQPGSLIGTPRYMSPEQAAGDLDRVGTASDVYSLGAILYCVLVGHDPFPDGDLPSVLGRVVRGIFPAPRRLRRAVDPALESICLKAMAHEPHDRYATALALAGELEAWLADVRYRGEHAVVMSQTRGTLARLCFERARGCFDRQAHSEGMLWLARALENAPSEPRDLERAIRTSLSGWHTETKLLERSLRHGCAVRSLAFCPEGRRLATAGEDQVARLWDIATGGVFAKTLRHDEAIDGVAFSPDGSSMVTTTNRTIRRWDAWTAEPRGEPLKKEGAGGMSFSPDGSLIAAPGAPGEAVVWNATDGDAIDQADCDGARVLAIAFAPDGKTIAVAHDDGAVVIRQSSGRRPPGEPLAHGFAVRFVQFDASGEKLLTASMGGEVRVWDVARRTPLVTLAHAGEICALAFRPGGDAFATVCDDGTARLWESTTGRPIGEPLGERARALCLAFRPDGLMVATGSADGTVRLWCAGTGLPIGPPIGQGGAVRTLAFSPDGRRLAAGGIDATVRCWKLPAPVEGSAERVSCWVSTTTELEFDTGDAIRRMDGSTAWALRRRLGELGGAPVR